MLDDNATYLASSASLFSGNNIIIYLVELQLHVIDITFNDADGIVLRCVLY